MQLMIDVSGSAREEIEIQLELGPPPYFNNVHDAIDWTDENLPINAYFEVWGKKNRIWYKGYVKTGEGEFLRGISHRSPKGRPDGFDLRSGR